MTEQNGRIFDIQRFSLDDGEGIRTVVFLQGCNLHCPWCHNPESVDGRPMIMRSSQCVGCGRCESICHNHCIKKEGASFISHDRCDLCGQCVDECVYGALRICGRDYTVDEVMEIIKKDKDYYEASCGGVTLSGGEPSLQWKFAAALLKVCHDAHINTAIETNGIMTSQARESLGPHLNMAMIDLKHADTQTHKKWLGLGNEEVINTIIAWSKIMTVEVRVPVIPGFNDTKEAVESICMKAKECGAQRIKLLPYHIFGTSKYKSLGITYELDGMEPMSKTKLQNLVEPDNAYNVIID